MRTHHQPGFVHPLQQVAREPRICLWEITRACDLQCVHCDSHSAARTPGELRLDQMLPVADELRALGCRTVDVTGGEPLQRSDWDRLCAHLSSLDIDVVLVTNGIRLDDEVVGRARTAGVKMVSVSIDGMRTTHDRTRRRRRRGRSPWEHSVAGIERARAHLPVAIITQVNRTNLGELPELGRFLGNLGVCHWQLQLAIPNARLLSRTEPYAIAPEDLVALTDFIVRAAADPGIPPIHASDTIGYCTEHEPILRAKGGRPGLWLGCVAGIRAVAIKPDGTVRGCSLMPPDFDAGSLHQESLTTIWRDETRFAYSTRFEHAQLAAGCAACRWGKICRAGCTTMAYWVTGSTGHNPYCLHRVRECPS